MGSSAETACPENRERAANDATRTAPLRHDDAWQLDDMADERIAELTIAPAADMHAHLRQGALMLQVVPAIRQGGVSTVYVMPNLTPPITSVEMALAYRRELNAIDNRVEYLMSLYLCPEITPDVIYAAHKAGIVGVKSYPRGVTTNSDTGVLSYDAYYPVFAAMQTVNMVLNLHGEVAPSETVTVMDAEQAFLPTLKALHATFPSLRIVLEHCTTAAAITAVSECGPTVAATITAHHLFLTIDSWVDNPFSYCKPVAKLPSDRKALLEAATSGDPRFFLGTDSAPHPIAAKLRGKGTAAGVYTQPYVLQYLAEVFDSVGKLRMLERFASVFGRQFYRLGHPSKKTIKLIRSPMAIETNLTCEDKIIPFKAGETLQFSIIDLTSDSPL